MNVKLGICQIIGESPQWQRCLKYLGAVMADKMMLREDMDQWVLKEVLYKENS